MIYKMVLTFSFLISSILGENQTNMPSFLQEVFPTQPQEELKTQHRKDWLKLNLPRTNFQLRDDEDLYGSWEMYEMYDYPDSTYTDGTSLEEFIIAFGMTLNYTFNMDNTVFMEASILGETNSGDGDWWTEQDSIFITYIDQEYYEEETMEMRYELFDIDDDESTGLSFFITDVDDYGDYSYGEIRFYYTGSGVDDECIEEGEIYCESGYFQDLESCEDEEICSWDDDQCWYDCESDENCDCDGEEDEENCGDMDACNYNPDSNPYEDDDCWYAEDEGWCDCDGNISDCDGECGGDNWDSCTIMYSEDAGFYENDDCSGDLISQLEGFCLIGGYGEYFPLYFSEEECTADGGIWLAADTCYSQSFEILSPEECVYNDGIIFDEDEGCLFDEQPSMEDCFTAGGSFDYYTGNCYVDEYGCSTLGGTWGNMAFCGFFIEEPADTEEECHDYMGEWIESEVLFDDIPNLYFFDDGSFGSMCDYDCQFQTIPSQEECYNAGGEYESWGECAFEEMPSEEECESVYGYYDEYDNECYVWDEEDCNTLNGTWESEIDCYIENENSCTALDGSWYEGVCPEGTYSVVGTSITFEFFDGEGPDDELTGELEYDEFDNWTSIEVSMADFYGSLCIGMIWTSTPPDLAITDSDVSLPVELTIDNVYPNPFNPKTEIHYTLPITEDVTISVYDITGKKVSVLLTEMQNAGEHSVVWNAEKMSSGVYFIRLQTDDKIRSHHVILLK